MKKTDQQTPHHNGQGGNKPKRPNLMWIYLAIIAILSIGLLLSDGQELLTAADLVSHEYNYTNLKEMVQSGKVESVEVSDKKIAKLKIAAEYQEEILGKLAMEQKNNLVEIEIPSIERMDEFMEEVNQQRQEAGEKAIEVSYVKDKNYLGMILMNVVPLLLMVLFFVWMMRGIGSGAGGIFNVGKAKAQLFDKDKKDKVTFKDVAGLEGAKEEIQEIVSFLKNPEKYTELGGKIPKGALLVGPPGTGKTLLAKAVAGEADVPFFSMSGSDFVEMFVGVGASRVRDLFRQAKEKAPSIIFIDEIDAIGRARGKNVMSGGNDERESTLNQLLTEMDGFGTNSGVIILAATNRAEILDSALLRAGRFDRQIHVELPDLKERIEIFGVHLRPLKKLDPNVDVNFLAKQTPGFSGADIANVCNEAALIAARNDKKTVSKEDFMNAVDRIIGGLERKNKIMTAEEKRAVAYHEAGHATVSWLLKYGNPLVKVTIVPRGMALGAAWYLPEERQMTNTEHLFDEMCSLLGGRAAEEAFLHQTGTGALNDLERANKQAYAMVAYYGMSEKLKNLCFYDSTGQANYFGKPYSEHTAQLIDSEVNRMINEQMARAKQLLEEHAEQHHQIAELLIEKEVITGDDVEAILGPRPWKSRGDEIILANEEAEAESSDTEELVAVPDKETNNEESNTNKGNEKINA